MPTTKSGFVFPESREERSRRVNAYREKMESGHKTPASKRLEKELRKVDPNLRVVFVDPEAGKLPPAERGSGIIPGRWHIKILLRPRNRYLPLTGPNWEYREPELAVVEEMKARDLFRRGALEEATNAQAAEEASRRRQELTEGEARVEQVAAAYRAAKRVPGDGGETRSFARKRGLSLPRGVANEIRKSTGHKPVAPELVLPGGGHDR